MVMVKRCRPVNRRWISGPRSTRRVPSVAPKSASALQPSSASLKACSPATRVTSSQRLQAQVKRCASDAAQLLSVPRR